MKFRFTLLILTIGGLLNCTSSKKYSPMDLVPGDTTIAISAKWQEVGNDSHLRKLANVQMINNRLLSLGIDPTTVKKLVLFSNRLDAKREDIGIILSGSYNMQDLVGKLKAQNFTRRTYQGHELYCNESDNQSLCSVRGGLLSVGTRESVESTLAVLQSPAKAFVRRPSIHRMITQSRESDYPLDIFLAVSQEVQDINNIALGMTSFITDLAGIGVVGELLDTIGFAKALSCSLVRRGNRFSVRMTVAMKDEQAAGLISGTLNLLKGASNLIPKEQMSTSDRANMDRFQDLKVAREQEILSIIITVPEEELIR